MEEHKDPWKSMIDENREAFNEREPKDLWNVIESKLDKEQKTPKTIELWKVYRLAAILVIVLAVAFFAMFQKNESLPRTAEENIEQNVEPYYPQELIEVENFYASEIEDKLSQVKELTDDDIIVEEIQLLKDEFEELKLELGDHVNDAEVIEAMIMNYKLRLDLLKEILDDLKMDENPSPKNTSYEAI